MKRIVCIVLALTMIAATAMILGGCGDDKSKTSSKASTPKGTTAATLAPTAAPTAAEAPATLAPTPQETLAPSDDTPTIADASDSADDDDKGYYDVYGGLSGQAAILKALSYAGAGYQCVSYDCRYLRNQEAWYIGLQASDGSDSSVYYLYVNENECVPVSEIPNIGGDNSEDSGVFDENYAGISEQEAIFRALEQLEDEYTCVSSQQSDLSGEEYWLVGIQKIGEPDSEVYYFYVNSESCFSA